MSTWKSLVIMMSMLLLVGQGCVSLGGNKVTTEGVAGVFVSTDKGENWSHLTALPEADGVKSIADANVYRMFEDPQDPNAMYLTTRAQGMYYTYDDGRTWQRPTDPILQSGFIYSVAVHPKDKCTIYVTNGNQVFRSNDCSRTYEEVYRESRSGVLIQALRFEHAEPYRLFMGEDNGNLLQSMDGGKSWTVLQRFDSRITHIEADRLKAGQLYIVTRDNGLYRSTDSGITWVPLADTLKDYSGALEYRGFVMHPTKQNVIYWVSTYGILYSINAGDTWQPIDLITPPGSVNIYSFAVNPKNDQEMYYTATLKDLSRSTFYRSIDGGKNWTTKRLPTGQVPITMRTHPVKDYLYLGFAIPLKK